MLTFLNIAKVLSWIAMVYMILTTTEYFMGAVFFYYIVLAVLAAIGFILVLCATIALKSDRAPRKAKIDAVVLLKQIGKETYTTTLAPVILSILLLWLVGLPILAYSQMAVAILDIWLKQIAEPYK